VECCDKHVCLSVCVCLRSCLRNNMSDLHQIFCSVSYLKPLLLLWLSDMLRIFGFMDDVIFAMS